MDEHSESRLSSPERVEDVPSYKTPACAQCRSRKIKCDRNLPECSSCTKAGLSCDFASQPKRVNKTRQLEHNIAGFGSRLKTIHGATSILNEKMDDLAILLKRSNSRQDGSRGPTPDELCFLRYSELSDKPSYSSSNTPNAFNMTIPQVVANGNGEIYYYGACSTVSLFADARNAVNQLLAYNQRLISENSFGKSVGRAPMARSIYPALEIGPFTNLLRIYESYYLPDPHRLDLGSDGESLSLPPQYLLRSCIDFWYANVELNMPLFDKGTLLEAMQQQSSNSKPDDSWTICFNNIILQSTRHRSRLGFKDADDGSTNDSVFESLMMNVKRALQDLSRFSQPTIVNVQAMVLLALVARDYFHFSVFERVFNQACHLAKAMGLHEGFPLGFVSLAQRVQRENIVWALYTIDKQRAFIKGSPCLIYLFECNIDIPLLSNSSSSGHEDYFIAHLRMACIVEEIYKHLYSPRSRRQAKRQNTVDHLHSELEAWRSKSQALLEKSSGTAHPNAISALHLQYAYLSTLILIQRCSEEARQEGVENARKALSIVAQLSNHSLLSQGSIVALERIFTGYSLIAFYEIFQDLLRQGCVGRSADVELLSTFSQALSYLPHPNYQDSYCARVYRNLAWCVEVAKALIEQRQQVSLGSTPSSSQMTPPSRLSTTHLSRLAQQDLSQLSPAVAPSGFLPYQQSPEDSAVLNAGVVPFSLANQVSSTAVASAGFEASGGMSVSSQAPSLGITSDSSSPSSLSRLADWTNATDTNSFHNNFGEMLQSNPIFSGGSEDFGFDMMNPGQGYEFLVNELQRGAC